MLKSIIKGKFAETVSNIVLDLSLDKNIYTVHKNVTLELNDDTTQIDHIIVSHYGIFVIETKNYNGWIFGDKKAKTWTQVLYKKRSTFQNPIHQNYKHIKFLQKILSIDKLIELKESDFISIVHFSGENVEFKTKLPDNVIKRGLVEYIKNHKRIKIANPIVLKKINERLNRKRLKAGINTFIKHSMNLSSKKENEFCPYCNGEMVIRTVKRGKSVGRKFLGCKNYPECKGTRKLSKGVT